MDLLELSIVLARTLIELIFFAIGASIFSFLNVVIYRLPRHIRFTLGKSMCTSCKHELSARDLIPIISWTSLRGRCRYCGEKISIRYTIIEFIGGAAAVAATLALGINYMALAAFLAAGVVTVVVCILYDAVTGRKL